MSIEPKKSKLLGFIIGAILIIGGIYAVFFIDWGKINHPSLNWFGR